MKEEEMISMSPDKVADMVKLVLRGEKGGAFKEKDMITEAKYTLTEVAKS
jgi:hypothetical protein